MGMLGTLYVLHMLSGANVFAPIGKVSTLKCRDIAESNVPEFACDAL